MMSNSYIVPSFYILYYTTYYIRKVFDISGIPNDFMKGFDRKLVQGKLNEMGMGDIARKLSTLSDKEIENMIRKNPAILKKASELMKGGK